MQGVGFRPFVYRLARRCSLAGWVLNDSRGVEIELEGSQKDIDDFAESLEREAPPLARIASVTRKRVTPLAETEFVIRPSQVEAEKATLISPDCATCDDCVGELFDPSDRRYRYPFINCTNCGPRYTIIRDFPYDRPLTTMSKFKMCSACQAEYDDPADRRFHAQPNACWDCGPGVTLLQPDGTVPSKNDDAVAQSARLLREGRILAIKGLGGFHLSVDATDEKAVARLRRRKFREAKPLAIMSPSLETIRTFCRPSPTHEKLLTSVQRPIVLCPKLPGGPIAESVAPRSRNFGVMLPYTPLHHLIMREGFVALVMTSGNQTDEPIAIDNDEALRRLGGIADAFLTHDRDILTRIDDSVIAVMGDSAVPVRRARGFAPAPIELPRPADHHILAVGAEGKNTFCFVRDNFAFPSQHIGDLDTPIALGFFEEVIERLQKLLQVEPSVIAHDLHPAYLSTAYAKRRPAQHHVGVQHHHAHIVSGMVEHSLEGEVIGLALDGTGYGTDGTIWGSELLVAGYRDFRRLGWLKPTPMPGGDRCVESPDRMAFSFLYSAYGTAAADLKLSPVERIPSDDRIVLVQMLEKGINSPPSSGMGRFFDAVSALLDVCPNPSFDGQPAIELEFFADDEKGAYPLEPPSEEPPLVFDPSPLIRAAVNDIGKGIPREVISARFHNSILSMCVKMSLAARAATGLDRVVLSGGVFQNQYLTERVLAELSERGFRVYLHNQVPPNDGCISLGQAAIAAERTSE